MIMTATDHSQTGQIFAEQRNAALFVQSTRSELLREPESKRSPIESSFDLTHSEKVMNSKSGSTDQEEERSAAFYVQSTLSELLREPESKPDQSLNESFDESLNIMQGINSSQINTSANIVTADNDGGSILPPTILSNSPEPRLGTVERGRAPVERGRGRGGRGGYRPHFYRDQPQYPLQHQGNHMRGSHYNNWGRGRGRGAVYNVNGNGNRNGNWMQAQGFVPMWPNIPSPYSYIYSQPNPYMFMPTYETYSYMGYHYQGILPRISPQISPRISPRISPQIPSQIPPPIPSSSNVSVPMPQNNTALQNNEDIDTRIMKQVNYYFCDENLIKDIFLRERMDPQGWVPIELIAGFTMIKLLTDNIDVVINAVQLSELVEVQGNKIRRREDFERWPILEPILNVVASLRTNDFDKRQ